MNILLSFARKTNSNNISRVKKILSNIKFIVDEYDMYIITFDSFNDNFNELLRICYKWVTTELYIDDVKIDHKYFVKIMNCPRMNICSGVCYNIKLIYCFGMQESFRNITHANAGYLYAPEEFKQTLEGCEFISAKNDEYIIDRNLLREKIIKQLDEPIKYCIKFNKELILEKIDKYPDKFKILNPVYPPALIC